MTRNYVNLNRSLKEIQELGVEDFADIEVCDILNHLKNTFEQVANDNINNDNHSASIAFRLTYKIAAMYVGLALETINSFSFSRQQMK